MTRKKTKEESKQSNIGINLSVDPQTIKELNKIIIDILGAKCEEETKRAALQTVTQMTSISHAVISNNYISLGKENGNRK